MTQEGRSGGSGQGFTHLCFVSSVFSLAGRYVVVAVRFFLTFSVDCSGGVEVLRVWLNMEIHWEFIFI